MSFPIPNASPHHLFAGLVGGWAGRSRTWLEPEGDPVEAAIQGSIQLVLEGRFALFLYQSSIDSEAQHGIFTFGFNTLLDRYEAAWIDSFHNHTAIMFCTGAALDNGFSVIGTYPDPSGGPDWSWRTDVQIPDPEHLTITGYNITPEGLEARAAETLLARLKK